MKKKKRRIGNKRKYTINHDYFNKWSHDMAYILGLWFTDGYMSESRCEVSITQHKKDKYLLMSILTRMGSNSPLKKHGKNSLQFRVFSQKMTDDIKKYGGHQNKSYTITFPKMIPRKYMPDFVRGCWDGDGCVWSIKRKGRSGTTYFSSIISASNAFIKGLRKKLCQEIDGFKGKIRKVKNYYVLDVGINDTRRLGGYLYQNVLDDSLFLERKYLKFKSCGEIRLPTYDRKFKESHE